MERLLLPLFLLWSLFYLPNKDGPFDSEQQKMVDAIHSLREVYGPDKCLDLDYTFFSYDLNEDKSSETIVLLQRKDRGYRGKTVEEVKLGESFHCDGFVVFTRVPGGWWPVFYRFEDYDGFSLAIDRVEGKQYPQLVSRMYKGMWQVVWGWDPGVRFESPYWVSQYRKYDEATRGWSPYWKALPYISVHIGK